MVDVNLKNVSISFNLAKKDKIQIIKDLNITFPKGKINVIIGPSGCGKTTLLKAICGLIDLDKGDIYFDDVRISNYSIKDRNISLVNQNIVLYPHMNVFSNISYPLRNTKAGIEEIRERVDSVSKLFKISHLLSRKPKELSIGQQQRVAIARALIKRSNVYLFDEPFSNLDEQNKEEIRFELKKILQMLSSTVIFVTHDIKEAMLFADFIYVMSENGDIVDIVNKENVLDSKNELTKELVGNGLK